MKYAARLFISTSLVLFLLSPVLAGAFGVSPPFINIDRLVKGSRYETTIFLVQGDPKEDLEVKAIFDVPEKIRSWFTVDKGEQFIIPAGIQQFPIKVVIQVPEDAGLGIYKGHLRVNTVPKRVEGEQISISVGARIDINLTVGEGAFADFKIRRVDILDIKEGEPPQIVVTLENIGNVSIGPDRATFDLFDKYGEVRLGFAQNENLPETPAFETRTFVVEFPIDIKLGLGEYWAEAKIYREGAVVGELKTVFNVVEKKKSLLVWIILFVVLVILGAGVYKFIWLKRIR